MILGGHLEEFSTKENVAGISRRDFIGKPLEYEILFIFVDLYGCARLLSRIYPTLTTLYPWKLAETVPGEKCPGERPGETCLDTHAGLRVSTPG